MNTSEIKTEITIDFSTLSAEQAFRLGQLLAEVPAKIESSFTSEQTLFSVPTELRKRKTRTKSVSNKFRYNTSYEAGFIQDLVKMRQKGMKFQQIADYLNELSVPTTNGSKWLEQSVWSVIYSKQALEIWTAA
jgi:hypothetical protein